MFLIVALDGGFLLRQGSHEWKIGKEGMVTKIDHGRMIKTSAICEKCGLQHKIIYEDGSTVCTFCGKRDYDSLSKTVKTEVSE